MKLKLKNIVIFRNEYLYVLEYKIRLQIDALKVLVDNDEKSIHQIKEKFDSFLKSNKFKEIENQHKDIFEESIIDKENITKRLLIQKRYSNCLMIFSVFESVIYDFCKEVNLKTNVKNTESVNKNNEDLAKYKKYLIEQVGIDFTKLQPSFTKLKQQKIIRNRIAHNNGRTNKSDKIHIVKGIIISNNEIKICDDSYFEYLIKTIEEFFKQLLIEIDLKIKFI